MTSARMTRLALRGMRMRRTFGLLVIGLLLGLYSRTTARTARADGATPSDPLAAGALGGAARTAGAGDPGPSPPGPASGPPALADAVQQASTEQGAAATAAATQQRPKNVVISIRINSPGNNGAITQNNGVVAIGAGTNDASTNQGATTGAAGDGQGGSAQDAATNQAANAAALAQQEQAENIVISIRINSPGDDGPIDQTNLAVGIAAAENVGVTNQGVPTSGGPDRDAGTAPVPDPRVSIGPPAQQTSPAPPAGDESPTAPVAASTVAPKAALTGGHATQRPMIAARTSSASAPRPAPSSHAASPAQVSAGSEAREARGSRLPVKAPASPPARSEAGIQGQAVSLLGRSLASMPSPRAGEGDKQVSSAVVLTLIAVLCAFLVYLASRYMPGGLRLAVRNRWHG